jgi:uncharacterized phiE125 gp8 family phage protein
MWYPATVTDAADVEPVTLAEVKKHCRAVYHTDDDAYLENLIASARDHVERYTGTRLAEQIVTLKCDRFADFAAIPEVPLQSVAVTYVDADGAAQTLADTVYELRNDGLDCAIVLKFGQAWPPVQTGSRITVTAVAGYEATPPAIKHAILLWVGSAYEVREDAPSGGRTAFDDLLTNFRR